MKVSFVIFFLFFFCFFGNTQHDIQVLRNNQKKIRNYSCSEIQNFAYTFQQKDSILFYYLIAKSQRCSSDYFDAYKSFLKVLSKINVENPILEAEIQLEIATCLSILNQKGDALDYFLKVKQRINSTKDPELKLKYHLAFGEFNRKYAKFNNAENELRKGLELATHDKFYLTSYLNRIAAVKTEKAEIDSSLIYSNKALKLAYDLNNYNLIATSENEIAFVTRGTDKWQEAIEKYALASKYWSKVGMNLYALDARAAISTSMQDDKKNNYRNQKQILLDCLKEASKNKWHYSELIIVPQLIHIYRLLNKKDSVDFYHIYYLNARINLMNIENKTNTSFIELKYQQTTNKNIILTQKQKLIEKQRQNMMYLVFSISIGLILLLVTYILLLQIKKKKQFKIDKIEEEKRNKNLEILLREKTALVQEVHHRVKNNLQFMDAMVNMQSDLTENKFGKEALEEISRRLKSMSLVHEMIYTNDTMEFISSCDYVKQLLEISKDMLGVNEQKQNIEFDLTCEEIQLNINKTMALGIIISELIANSMKYAFKEQKSPKITIQMEINNSKSIVLNYTDNGCGFQKETAKNGLGLKLIDIFSR